MEIVEAMTPIGRVMSNRNPNSSQTPGLSVGMRNLEIDEDECLCSKLCECGAWTPIDKVMEENKILHTPGLSSKLKNLEIEEEECLCSRLCECGEVQEAINIQTECNTGARTSIEVQNIDIDVGVIQEDTVDRIYCPNP